MYFPSFLCFLALVSCISSVSSGASSGSGVVDTQPENVDPAQIAEPDQKQESTGSKGEGEGEEEAKEKEAVKDDATTVQELANRICETKLGQMIQHPNNTCSPKFYLCSQKDGAIERICENDKDESYSEFFRKCVPRTVLPTCPEVTTVKCGGLRDGNHPIMDYENGCSAFFVTCVHNLGMKRRCASPMTRFDQKSDRCLFADYVQECGGISTPVPDMMGNPPSDASEKNGEENPTENSSEEISEEETGDSGSQKKECTETIGVDSDGEPVNRTVACPEDEDQVELSAEKPTTGQFKEVSAEDGVSAESSVVSASETASVTAHPLTEEGKRRKRFAKIAERVLARRSAASHL